MLKPTGVTHLIFEKAEQIVVVPALMAIDEIHITSQGRLRNGEGTFSGGNGFGLLALIHLSLSSEVAGALFFQKLFSDYIRKLEPEGKNFACPLFFAKWKLPQPFILRCLKTDKRIISDLPDKIELKVYCHLTKSQAALQTYMQSPVQFLGNGYFEAGMAGKLLRLFSEKFSPFLRTVQERGT